MNQALQAEAAALLASLRQAGLSDESLRAMLSAQVTAQVAAQVAAQPVNAVARTALSAPLWQSGARDAAIAEFRSYDAIVQACKDAWNFLAEDPMRIASIGHRQWACVRS